MKPRLLDLFCGAGGAARGYQRAGFYVVGVDINPQPRYAGDEFVQADALTFPLDGFDTSHASPPCQAHTSMKTMPTAKTHADFVSATRELLRASRLPYVIENVVGAPLLDPTMLCGSSFGLGVQRHRLFECDFPLMAVPCAHGMQRKQFDILRHGVWSKSRVAAVYGTGGGKAGKHWGSAMGIDWMTRPELAQAIPPAFTEHIGEYLMREVMARRALAA